MGSNLGTSQSLRKLEALEPDYFKVDEKSLYDFVEFASKFSQILSYYDRDNHFSGNWFSFFNNDITILLIQISSVDAKMFETKYNQIVDNIQNENETNVSKIFTYIYELFAQIETWQQNTESIRDFNSEIKKLIKHRLNTHVSKFIQIEEEAIKENLCDKQIKQYNFHSSSHWNLAASAHDNFYFLETEINKKIGEVLKIMFPIFHTLNDIIQTIVNSSKRYVKYKLNDSQEVQPHISLFIAFIEIYKQAQYDINSFTKRHLDYYYKEILKFKKKEEIPDEVHVVFELYDDIDSLHIKEGKKLSAEKDIDGNDLVYKLTNDVAINRAKVSSIKAVINTDDIEEELQTNPNIDIVYLNRDSKTENNYKLGFVLASSFLKLEEGQRKLKFTFHFHQYEFDNFVRIFTDEIIKDTTNDYYKLDDMASGLFDISYSTIEDDEQLWFDIPQNDIKCKFVYIEATNEYLNQLEISADLDIVYPSIDRCIEDIYPEAKLNKLPVFKFVINQNNNFAYRYIKDFIIEKIQFMVEVYGVKNLKLQNDYGLIDSNIPFEPFSSVPILGSTFYIGHETIFSQQLEELHINFEWFDIPLNENGFAEYYQGYSFIDGNDVFKAKISALHEKKWIPSTNQQVINLFEDEELKDEPINPINRIRIIDDIDLEKINSVFKGKTPVINNQEMFSNISRNGFIKLEFNFPPNGFGNKEYPQIIKQTIANKSNEQINEPWTPTLKNISINYVASVIVDLNKQDLQNKTYLYHLHPFGVLPVSEQLGSAMQFIPNYDNDIEVYVGITGINKLRNISMLFQIDEFSAGSTHGKENSEWSVLNNNKWSKLLDDQIIRDTTHDLIHSGVIIFDLSGYDKEHYNEKTLKNNSLCPPNYIWLKCRKKSNAGFVGNIIDIKCQAAIAIYENNNNSVEHLIKALPANTIETFVEDNDDVNIIFQPYKSFGGKPEESEIDFDIRVSERLRHKNRAITEWDYEHIILQKFPDIFRAICLNSTNDNMKKEPGSVLIVVLPFVAEKDIENIKEPKFNISKLKNINNYLSNLISPFIKLYILNPVYEHVKVRFDVKFRSEYDEKLYLQIVEKDLKNALNPWYTKDIVGDNLSTILHGFDILYYLEKREYIDYVLNFAVYHIVDGVIVNYDEAAKDNVILKPKTSVSVFIPAEEQSIYLVGEKVRESEALGNIIVETDFIIERKTIEKTEQGIGKNMINIDWRVEGKKNKKEEIKNDVAIIKL